MILLSEVKPFCSDLDGAGLIFVKNRLKRKKQPLVAVFPFDNCAGSEHNIIAVARPCKIHSKEMKRMSSSKIVVPQAREALDRFKMEAANEVGVSLKDGYNGELTSKQAGSVGGQMVKKMIESYESNLK